MVSSLGKPPLPPPPTRLPSASTELRQGKHTKNVAKRKNSDIEN